MVIFGWNNLELAQQTENDEDVDKVTNTIPVDDRSDESVQNSNTDQVVSQILPYKHHICLIVYLVTYWHYNVQQHIYIVKQVFVWPFQSLSVSA